MLALRLLKKGEGVPPKLEELLSLNFMDID